MQRVSHILGCRATTKGALVGCWWLLSLTVSAPAGDRPAPQAAQEVSADHAAKMTRGLEIFKQHVRGLLIRHCVKCHGGQKVEGELDLMERDSLMRGGATGPAIVAGNAGESLLYKLLGHLKEPFMPHNRAKLPDEAIRHIADWIDNGAPYDSPLRPKDEDPSAWTRKTLAAGAKQFWSFAPLVRTRPPDVKNEAWVRTPIDRFILARLETSGVVPNPPATRQQLIRRAYFDLLGLPPDPDAVDAFQSDQSPNSYGKLVDRLLESPHYGERWGRHWLDLARFAESHGFEHDYDRPSAYHYRDFVISALNEDLPFNTFVKWQIAGDEYAPGNYQALKATGFLAAGVHSTQITKREVEKQRYDELDDMLATTGTALLGLTLGCARCHDHKYDPIPQRDYYQLLSTFTTTVRSEVEAALGGQAYLRAKTAFDKEHEPLLAALERFERAVLPLRLARWEESKVRMAALPAWQGPRIDIFKNSDGTTSWNFHDASVQRTLTVPRSKRTRTEQARLLHWYRVMDSEWRGLHQAVTTHSLETPKSNLVKVLVCSEGLPAIRLHTQGEDYFSQTYFLRRGDPEQKFGAAPLGFLQALTPAGKSASHWCVDPPKGWRTSYRRRALAEWLTDVSDGAGRLLARVIVNRLWQHHMGRGLVATPSDFGVRGERPTHPELLDWLATELIRSGWRLKPIHRLIMTSAVYCESSSFSPEKWKIDSDNRLCWRRIPHRLEAEIIRDNLLAVSGELDPSMFGPGTLDPASRRRSIYLTVKRSKLVPMMQVFDAPEALGGVGDRPTSTVAPQALLLMNNPEVRGYALSLAKRCASGPDVPWENAIHTAYSRLLGRGPTTQETADSTAFLDEQTKSYRPGHVDARMLAMTDFCQALMCTNEFVYVD
jgi:hypothetical protein